MRFHQLLLWLLLPAAPLAAQLPIPAPGYLVSVTENVAVLGPTNPLTPITLTATVATGSNAPVSSLDGLMVNFGGILAPVKNGTATAQYPYDDVHCLGQEIEVDFPSNYNPVAGGSFKLVTIVQRCPGVLSSALSGDYVFTEKSYTGNGTARGGEGVSTGVLHFAVDGKDLPSITGEFDYNGALGSFQAIPVTGTYSIDGNGVTALTVHSSLGTQHFSLAIKISQLAYSNRISQASLVETDTPFLAGSGMLYARNVVAQPNLTPPPTKTDPYWTVFQLSGQSFFGTPFPLPVSLRQNSDGNLPSTLDFVAGAYVQGNVSGALGDSSKPDAFGRFTFPLIVPNPPAQLPLNYAGYGIDDSRVLVLSTDPAANKVVLSGEVDMPTALSE